MPNYNNNPYAVQYGQGRQPPQAELLPSFRRTPPPSELMSQARQSWNDLGTQARQYVDEYGLPVARWLTTQIAQNAVLEGLTGKTLGQHLTGGIGKGLNTPQALATIATIEATKAGAPVVNGIRTFANSPAGQKVKNIFEKTVDWFL